MFAFKLLTIDEQDDGRYWDITAGVYKESEAGVSLNEEPPEKVKIILPRVFLKRLIKSG